MLSARAPATQTEAPPRTTEPRTLAWAEGPICLALVVYLVAFGWAILHPSWDVWLALVVAPVLAAVTVPAVCRTAHRDGDAWTARLLFYTVIVKLCGGIVRYALTYSLYDASDASRYHSEGATLAAAFRHGDFALGPARIAGTRFIEIVTGVVYTLIGPNKICGFLVFSWFGFLGLYLFYRAFELAVPAGDHRRYGLLLFFLPSLVFWPSSIGKEAWLTFALGLGSYGAARILTRRRAGFVLTGIGAIAIGVVRPHVALLLLAGMMIGYLLRRGERITLATIASRVVGTTVLVVALLIGANSFKSFFNVDALDLQSVETVLSRTETQTAEGGSEFNATPVRSPLDYPQAAITVLFRPFPTEAHNAQALAAALESTFILGLIVFSWDRLVALPRAVARDAYVGYALTFLLLFIYGFSVFGNFGILVRQRVQVLPFLLVLLAVPVDRRPTTVRANARR